MRSFLLALCLFCAPLFAESPDFRYWYECTSVHVVDGDTIDCETVDLGFDIRLHKQRFRLYAINATETRGSERPEGLKTKEWLMDRIQGKDIILKSIKDGRGKYGRLLAIIYDGEVDLNAEMVKLGLAEYREY